MQIEIGFSTSFKRIFRKRIAPNKELENLFWQRTELFSKNPFDPLLKTHKLSGDMGNLWSFSLNFHIRVVFQFIEQNKAIFIDIGTHDEVY